MDLRFDDQQLVLALFSLILDHCKDPFEVRSYKAGEHNAMRELLG